MPLGLLSVSSSTLSPSVRNMNNTIRKSWRDSASLIVLTRKGEVLSQGPRGVSYDILLQTRTRSASFPSSVVFPGGVCEQADAADGWRTLLATFGFAPRDFDALHRPGTTLTPLFRNNPIQSHISLRITAIRETFEELGLLICSRRHKKDRTTNWASVITDIDVNHWQPRVSENPEELLNLCKEYNCYPDIWSLHYWSNWLSPVTVPRRFDTAFFVAAVESKLPVASNSEVTKVEWSCPVEVLSRPDIILYPPQVYELSRLACTPDLQELVKFAKDRSPCGEELVYPSILKAKDGALQLLPGDDLYPASIDFNDPTVKSVDKTLAELRENCKVLHRFEIPKQGTPAFIIRNHKPANHINMGDVTLPTKITVH